MADVLNFDTSVQRLLDSETLSLMDLEAIRLILQGSSVIDWHQLAFTDLSEVDHFLRLMFVDPESEMGKARLRYVFHQAANYVQEHLDLRLPAELRLLEDPRQLFLEASATTRRFRRQQLMACTLLKLMHVVNHMEAAELKFQAAVPEATLIERADARIKRHADAMRSDGYPILAFYGNRKTRMSTITKLIAKRENLAATIFDKLRFRLIVETPQQILPLIGHLSRELFPFNYLIPDQSHNNLIPFRRLLREDSHYAGLTGRLQRLRRNPVEWLAENNPFSGNSYRTVNFIVDFPVRIEPHEQHVPPDCTHLLGRTVFVMVEFQIVDQATAESNETGDNAHHLYKARQKKVVEGRLLQGSLAKLKNRGGS